MTSCVKRYKNEICCLSTFNKQQKVKIFKDSSKTSIKGLFNALSDISNVLLHNSRFVNQLTKQQRKQLRKHIRPLKVLESKKVSLKRKEKILTIQSGKGLLTDIWKAVKGIFNI